ncbi:MAG: helix-turn-helix transcriptional regulator [Oscillospiraceae bacterium]|nr:helix-turn-helix transcriptional regulator [Oscillospiraceae bacterium]
MEKTFGARLKAYRKGRNMTQQELADLLGVSNKTVSRWESDGGYPDVPLLVPLAKALGVTTDDLLNEEKPIRSLSKTDLQSLLSFVFVLGGGALFYLLNQFMPILLCYLGYLACMAYGVYLQRYYSDKNRWFRIANGVMNAFVNVSLVLETGLLLHALPFTLVTDGSSAGTFGAELLYWYHSHLPLCIGLGIAAAAGLTVTTLLLVERVGFGREAFEIRPRVRRPSLSALLPALCSLLLAAFWLLWLLPEETGLPKALFLNQDKLWLALVLAAFLLTGGVSAKKKSLRGGLGTLLLAGEGLLLPYLTTGWYRYSLTGVVHFVQATADLSRRWSDRPEKYILFRRPEGTLFAAALAVTLLLLAIALVSFGRPEQSKED